jgi:hypothetical protein
MSTFQILILRKWKTPAPNVWVFRNPKRLFIRCQLDIHPVTAMISDIQGRQIMTVRGLTGTSRINTSKLSIGSYVIQILDEVTNDKANKLILKY